MDPIEYRLSQRRQLLRRGWIATLVFVAGVAGVAGVAVAPEVSGNATGFLAIPGLAGLGVAGVLFKPFDPLTLAAQISESLGWE